MLVLVKCHQQQQQRQGNKFCEKPGHFSSFRLCKCNLSIRLLLLENGENVYIFYILYMLGDYDIAINQIWIITYISSCCYEIANANRQDLRSAIGDEMRMEQWWFEWRKIPFCRSMNIFILLFFFILRKLNRSCHNQIP